MWKRQYGKYLQFLPCVSGSFYCATIQIKLWEFDGKSQTFSLWNIKKEKLDTFRFRGFASFYFITSVHNIVHFMAKFQNCPILEKSHYSHQLLVIEKMNKVGNTDK